MRLIGAVLATAALCAATVAQAKPEKKLEPTFHDLGHIHGYLVAPSGEGLTGMVSLTTTEGCRISLHNTYSMRKGRFDIDNLLPGRYRLRVETVGAIVTDLEPPAPLEIEVLPNKVIRPRLTARCP